MVLLPSKRVEADVAGVSVDEELEIVWFEPLEFEGKLVNSPFAGVNSESEPHDLVVLVAFGCVEPSGFGLSGLRVAVVDDLGGRAIEGLGEGKSAQISLETDGGR